MYFCLEYRCYKTIYTFIGLLLCLSGDFAGSPHSIPHTSDEAGELLGGVDNVLHDHKVVTLGYSEGSS